MDDAAIGFAQEIPGGYVFELGNSWIHRRIHSISGRIGTTSLVNALNGEEYLDQTNAEFEITVSGEGQKVVLDFKDFNIAGYETPDWNDEIKTIEVKLESEVNDELLRLSVFYQVRAGDSFMRKWIKIEPCDLLGWAITSVTIESIRMKEMVEGVIPMPRYTKTHSNNEDNVHIDPDKANVTEPERRFSFGDTSRAIVTYWGYNEGLFFFTESLTGEEDFHRPTGLIMKHRDFVPLTEGLTTGAAIIGAYSGAPEVGFRRYNEHLMNHWCVINGKNLPVEWNTWFVTREGNQPILSNFDRNLLFDTIERLRDAGFFDALHLDLGWESGWPLRIDSSKFPNGIAEVVRKAKDAAGLDMSYWINPFSCSYWRSSVEDEHPEWTVPGKTSGRSGALAMCVMSDYFEYVKKRFLDLVTEMNARSIYWDGNDWNIPECELQDHDHKNVDELRIKAWKRLAEICREAHEAREDLVISAFSLPLNNHRLCALDQEQISDTHKFPTIQAELIQRQQLYQMTWEHPYRAIRGSWYGVGWHEAGQDNLTKRPLHELFHAEMSMIGNGLAQAGGSVDFNTARPEFVEFLKKLFAFRKRFEKYFDTYQHVLGFPDGKSIDGAGHVIDDSGFIVLVNPTEDTLIVRIPLDAPELELSAAKKHELTDWSSLDHGTRIDSATIDKAPEIELEGLEVKYIGVNIRE
ncbi:MAG: hypothetical protein ABFD54_07340 [Armatimonadota bacterium]|nr:hypothetical protein [bacterium]